MEKQARDKTPDAGETKADCIHRFREEHSLPVLKALKTWLDDIAQKVVPDTKLGDAVLHFEPMELPNALHQRRQDAD
nr:hypothetical protein [Rhizobium leguminosarum]